MFKCKLTIKAKHLCTGSEVSEHVLKILSFAAFGLVAVEERKCGRGGADGCTSVVGETTCTCSTGKLPLCYFI